MTVLGVLCLSKCSLSHNFSFLKQISLPLISSSYLIDHLFLRGWWTQWWIYCSSSTSHSFYNFLAKSRVKPIRINKFILVYNHLSKCKLLPDPMNKYPQLVSNTGPGRGMKPLYWRSVNSKDAGGARLTHHHKGQTKWNEINEMRVVVEWRICVRGKLEKPREKPTQTPFLPPRNPHEVTETQSRDPAVGGERLTACATEPPF